RPTYTTQKPSVTTTMHHTGQPATSTSQSSQHELAGESGYVTIGQPAGQSASATTRSAADQTKTTPASAAQSAKKLPQTNEQSHDGLVILGLSLLSFSLGLGYLDLRQRKEN